MLAVYMAVLAAREQGLAQWSLSYLQTEASLTHVGDKGVQGQKVIKG